VTSGYLPRRDRAAKCIVWGGDVTARPALSLFWLHLFATFVRCLLASNVYVVQSASDLSLVCVATNVRKAVTSAVIHLNAEIAGGDVSVETLATACMVNGSECEDPETAVKAMFRGSPGATATLSLDAELGSVIVTFLKTV